jgi:NhaA family Na+:H+ antiporter
VIIAIFYSSNLYLPGAVLALVGLCAIYGLQRLGVRHILGYAIPAVAVWAGCWWAGIHPTVAGILVGLLTPASTWYGHQGFLDASYRHLGAIARVVELPAPTARDVARPMSQLRRAQREAVSPVVRLEAALHAWAAFAIMPLFALANAGIDFGRVDVRGSPRLVAGIVGGLVVGKLAGILIAVRLAVKLRVADVPAGVTWRGLVVIGAIAGVGFTMALFIANLAFRGRAHLQDVSAVAVLLASAVAGAVALVLGRTLLPNAARDT